MPKFLIEIPHSSEYEACVRASHALLSSGSHYVTHADWGCEDGVHKAWMMVESDSKADALLIVPPAFRADATVIAVDKFDLEKIQKLMEELSPE